MTRSDAERIADITEAAHQVAELVARGRDAFDRDLAVRFAIERLLEIIGEAASRLTDEARAARPSVPWLDIARLRIVLAHHYHRVDPDQVWQIASVEVPALVAQPYRRQCDPGFVRVNARPASAWSRRACAGNACTSTTH